MVQKGGAELSLKYLKAISNFDLTVGSSDPILHRIYVENFPLMYEKTQFDDGKTDSVISEIYLRNTEYRHVALIALLNSLTTFREKWMSTCLDNLDLSFNCSYLVSSLVIDDTIPGQDREIA